MAMRADFYVGRGVAAEWVGSISWGGDPFGIPDAVKAATTEDYYREALARFFAERDDCSDPADGWPWGWATSETTDYAYAFDGGLVYASGYGPWFVATDERGEEIKGERPVFPDMSGRKAVKP